MNGQAAGQAVELPLDTILHADCRQALAELPAASVDLIFADPPYNLQLQQELYRPNQTKVNGVADEWDHFSSLAEYDAFCREWLTQCRRVMKDTATLWVIGTYHNIFRIGAILQDLGFWFLNDVIWVKTNPMPNFRGVRFTNAHETLIWACKFKRARYTFNYRAMKALNDDLQMRSDWLIPICTGEERLKANGGKAHSTQKPEALLYRILLAASNPGDVVLDPFFGSGTTGVVAKKLRRRWIGIEREADFVRLAQARIAAVTPADEASLAVGRREQPRVPFGNLLAAGLLQPGERLVFDQDRSRAAIVRADGTLEMGELRGTIHKLTTRLLGGVTGNGWQHWYYERDGKLHLLDELRQEYRRLCAAELE